MGCEEIESRLDACLDLGRARTKTLEVSELSRSCDFRVLKAIDRNKSFFSFADSVDVADVRRNLRNQSGIWLLGNLDDGFLTASPLSTVTQINIGEFGRQNHLF